MQNQNPLLTITAALISGGHCQSLPADEIVRFAKQIVANLTEAEPGGEAIMQTSDETKIAMLESALTERTKAAQISQERLESASRVIDSYEKELRHLATEVHVAKELREALIRDLNTLIRGEWHDHIGPGISVTYRSRDLCSAAVAVVKKYSETQPDDAIFRLYSRKLATGQDKISPDLSITAQFRSSPMTKYDCINKLDEIKDQFDEYLIIGANEDPSGWPSQVAWDAANPLARE